MVVEVPFVVFAALLPFIATGPRIEVLGLSVSEPGLLGAWGLLVKGTLGVLAGLLLAATTEPRALLAGLERLRLPDQLVQIMGFMIRYLDVVTEEMRRMHVARQSRGFDARNPTALAGAREVGRCPVHPLVRARRAGAPRDAVPRLHGQDAAMRPHDPVLDRRRAWPTPIPTDTRRCSAWTCTSTAASGWPCSGPTAQARPRSCCTSTASSPAAWARSASPGCP